MYPGRPQADAVGPHQGAEHARRAYRVSVSSPRSNGQDSAPRVPHGWADAFVAVLAGMIAMIVVAVLGLWAAGAGQLPGGAFPASSRRSS
ncbi:hypothetical protein Sfulv_03250 [Streptomyces fulvorobeus]|uniref:Uncharacterized protein n=1 Tax=Streptomyces fulvorobeus TaxID=284028 RepID=A0A7J0C0L3_9ACTN|nr:hypothetical protein Sfulv_03250 [Streptomyces fulvorobeus]